MIYRSDEVDPKDILRGIDIVKRGRGNPRTRQSFKYLNIITAFDIETTRLKTGDHDAGTKLHPHIVDDYIAFMYIWQWQLGPDYTVIGRTWDEFNVFLNRLTAAIKSEQRVIVFVHYLAHEFQYLRDPAIMGPLIDEESVFMVKPRTPVKFVTKDGKLEFRCSAIHSNMSLDEYTSKMKVQHQKLSGDEFDYNKIRYPWTELTDRELEYCTNDVQGLIEAIDAEMYSDGDNLYTFPLTSTGYVRRDMKRARQQLPHGYVEKQLPDYDTYKLLREAFRGGNTHANRYWTGKRCNETVYCRDFASCYPYVLINRLYPITPFKEIAPAMMHIDHIIDLIQRGRAVIARIGIYDLRLRDTYWPVPYLSRDKCRQIYDAQYDNGRILHAQYVETTVTDIDLKIIMQEYDIDDSNIVVFDARFASYGYLPDPVRDVIREYYRRKTEYKGDDSMKIPYEKEKAKLNACYGMMAQNPVKLNDCYRDGDFVTGLKYKLEDGTPFFLTEEEAYDLDIDIYAMAHHYNIDKSTLPYQWGVYCTAHARACLERAIGICHDQSAYGDFLYCDTDSVYFYGDKDFSALNADAEEESQRNRAYAVDINHVTRFMGVMEIDKVMSSFKTLGAKKYAYIDKKGLRITIAGVNKSKGAAELAAAAADANKTRDPNHQIDGLTVLSEGFVFCDAGGTESQYNDEPIPEFELDGRICYIPTNVAIVPSTYKVGLSDDYETLLNSMLHSGLADLYWRNYVGAPLPSIEV